MGSTEPGRVTIELTESVGSVGWPALGRFPVRPGMKSFALGQETPRSDTLEAHPLRVRVRVALVTLEMMQVATGEGK